MGQQTWLSIFFFEILTGSLATQQGTYKDPVTWPPSLFRSHFHLIFQHVCLLILLNTTQSLSTDMACNPTTPVDAKNKDLLGLPWERGYYPSEWIWLSVTGLHGPRETETRIQHRLWDLAWAHGIYHGLVRSIMALWNTVRLYRIQHGLWDLP